MTYWLEGAAALPETRQRHRLQSANLNLLATSRARLHVAFLISVSVAGLLGFVVFPVRHMVVTADGSSFAAASRERNLGAVLETTGVKHQLGDVVVRSGREVGVERAVPVVVQADGRTLGWRTRAETIQGVLKELGIEVSPYDAIRYNGVEVGPNDNVEPAPVAVMATAAGGVNVGATPQGDVISIQRAVPLTILEDGHAISFQSSRPTLSMALSDAGITLGPADEVFPAVSSDVVSGMQVEVTHAKSVTLRTGSSSSVIYTQKGTLREALAEAGLKLGADDRVEPSADVNVTNGMTARLVRVSGRELIEKEPVVKKTVFKPDEELTGSASRVVPGKDGVRLRSFKVVIEDGVEKQKQLVKEWMEPEEQDTVIYYAASTIRAAGLQADTMNVASTRHVYATWYNASSSGKAATDPDYGYTASGVPVTRGVVAVDTRVIPLGTRLYVPGYGFAVASDRGGGIIGDMIDLGYPDGATVDWHTSWVDIYILSQ